MGKKINSRDSREKYWREILNQQKQSGLSVRKYCVSQKINYHTFVHWRARLASVQSSFLEIVKLKNESKAMQIQIHLPNGVMIELGNDLEAVVAQEFLKSLCGVNGGGHAKS